jgi:hypothetical protein
MMTSRALLRNAFAIYEAEDVISQVDDVDLFSVRPATFAHARRELHKKLVSNAKEVLGQIPSS